MTTIVLGLRVALAAVFLTAGVGKMLDLDGSERAVRDFGVPGKAAKFVATSLPLAELAAAFALIFRPSARWGAVLALLLLGAFITGIVRALARGEEPECHCFGQIHSAPAGRLTLARNVVLAAFAGVVAGYGSGPAVDTWVGARSAAELAAVALGIAAVAAAIYALSLRSTVQRLNRDLDVARRAAFAGLPGLPVGYDAPDFNLPDLDGERVTLGSLLARGNPVLLVFMSPVCGPCASLMPRVLQWRETLSERLTISVITMGTAEDNAVFGEEGLDEVLLQPGTEVSDMFGVTGTPSAVFISREGKIASRPAVMEFGIEPLVRLALRDGVSPAMEGYAA